ncbi:hypothetical protein JCM33374_g3253 [Metschnikowia sp. JCM 33374]|nr:hypothetical protein JCM33374_g3253 [Metschnikowia sp. JCM 33374]
MKIAFFFATFGLPLILQARAIQSLESANSTGPCSSHQDFYFSLPALSSNIKQQENNPQNQTQNIPHVSNTKRDPSLPLGLFEVRVNKLHGCIPLFYYEGKINVEVYESKFWELVKSTCVMFRQFKDQEYPDSERKERLVGILEQTTREFDHLIYLYHQAIGKSLEKEDEGLCE